MSVVVARMVNYFSCRINMLTGVEEKTYVTLGGQEPYLHIQGMNKDTKAMKAAGRTFVHLIKHLIPLRDVVMHHRWISLKFLYETARSVEKS